jgi:hypothetical protein
MVRVGVRESYEQNEQTNKVPTEGEEGAMRGRCTGGGRVPALHGRRFHLI